MTWWIMPQRVQLTVGRAVRVAVVVRAIRDGVMVAVVVGSVDAVVTRAVVIALQVGAGRLVGVATAAAALRGRVQLSGAAVV